MSDKKGTLILTIRTGKVITDIRYSVEILPVSSCDTTKGKEVDTKVRAAFKNGQGAVSATLVEGDALCHIIESSKPATSFSEKPGLIILTNQVLQANESTKEIRLKHHTEAVHIPTCTVDEINQRIKDKLTEGSTVVAAVVIEGQPVCQVVNFYN